MKLIDQTEIINASWSRARELYGKDASAMDERVSYNVGFKSGVEFAEERVIPLICDFAQWVDAFYHREVNDIWTGVGMRTIETTEELFEEFLKIREV
jgi:hypothetical protein